MATHIGNEGTVLVGNVAIGEITNFEINSSAAVAEDSALSDAWDSHLVGSKSWTASVGFRWDETDGGQGNLTIGSSVVLNLYPEGNAANDTYYTGTATVTSLTHSIERNAAQDVSIEATGNGNLTIATV